MATPKTLAELTYAVAVELKTVREGAVTTGGADDAFTDTKRTESTDYWKGGPVWIRYAAVGAAPTGEWSEVTGFTGGDFTLSPALTANLTAADSYAVGRRRYPLDILTQFVNAAYRELGSIPQTDETLAATTDTTEYTIPDEAINDLREVWLQTDNTYPSVNGWIKLDKGYWRQELDTLIVPQLPTEDSWVIKLVYKAEPPNLRLFSDELSPFVHPSRIVYKATANCLLWRAERVSSTSIANAINQRVNYMLDLDQKAKYDHPIREPRMANKILVTDFTGGSDFFRVNTPPGLVNLG